MVEGKDRLGAILQNPIIEPVIERIADTAFSAKIDPRVQAARRIVKKLGISEEDVVRKVIEYLPYALTAPTLGYKIGKDIRKGLKKRRRGRRRGRGR